MRTPSLSELQRDFFSALRLPLRGSSRRATELPACTAPHDPAFLATADRLIRPSPTLQPAECLELYHRQYWFRLLDSLAEDFPGLARLLGRDMFWAVLEDFLLEQPSTSHTLRDLGRGLPDFLARRIGAPDLRGRAVAVARLEWALLQAFVAPDRPVATPAQLARGVIALQPHVRLLELAFDASGWLHDDSGRPPIRRRRGAAAAWRTPAGGVVHAPLAPRAHALLARLAAAPARLEQWLEGAADLWPAPGTLTRWMAEWSGRGWFTVVPGSESSRD
jgi:hypothetical protein